MDILEEIKKNLTEELKKINLLKDENIEDTLKQPPQKDFGDLSTNISFRLSKKLKKSPNQIAEDISKKFKLSKKFLIKKIEVKNGYVNFFFDYDKLTELILKTIIKEKEKYGSSNYGKGKKILIEYSAPNPNKPQHIGHMRNNFIGMSIYNILNFTSFETHPVNWINDRGAHICKSLWGYLQFGKKSESKKIKHWKNLLDEWIKNPEKWLTPEKTNKKPDYFVMKYYVKANQSMKKNEEYDKQNRELLQEWENKNSKVRKLWKKMNSWAYEGWNETYKRQNCIFEKYYYESEIYERGKEITLKNIKNGIFFKSDEGTIVADLQKHNLPGLVFIRSDGTSMYSAADLALTEKKVKDFPNHKLIWVVGGGQKLYFQQLFIIMDLIKIIKKEECYHLDYGMVSLPEGQMSSRTGQAIWTDDLMNEVHELTEKEVEKRNPKLSKKEKYEISEKIALGAIKYAILKIDSFKDIIFDPKEIIKFEGNNGPYLQYACVRANKILQKAGEFKNEFKTEKLKDQEKQLIKKLLDFPEIVLKSVDEYKPNLIANYIYDLSTIFNEFYHACPVIKSKQKNFRLTLTQATGIVIKNGLKLLGVEVPKKM